MAGKSHFDLLIVGGGQAGVPLAHALAAHGWSVGLAERARLGGSCVNFGCTPTKAALASAHLAAKARRAGEFGLRIPSVEVDFAAVLERAREIAAESRISLEKRFEGRANPELIRGHARFTGREGGGFALSIGGRDVTASQVVLDTGARTRVPRLAGLEKVAYLHAGNWMDQQDLPGHVAFLGGGVLSLEMGQFYARLGSRVTLIMRGARNAGQEDPDVAEALREALARDGVEFETSTTIEGITGVAGSLELALRRDGASKTLRATHLFVALGRRPNTDDLGLETVGVQVDEAGCVRVDERLATGVKGVWAAGDIRGGPMFTNTSWDDFRILESQLAGDRGRTTRRIVPYAVFTDPELGRVGMTEEEAKRSGRIFDVKRFGMVRNGRAREVGEGGGFIKLLIERDTRQLLGAAVLAAAGGELVHLYVDLMNAGAPVTMIRDAVYIHPTLAEAVQSAVTA